jgi:hypothetical protein
MHIGQCFGNDLTISIEHRSSHACSTRADFVAVVFRQVVLLIRLHSTYPDAFRKVSEKLRLVACGFSLSAAASCPSPNVTTSLYSKGMHEEAPWRSTTYQSVHIFFVGYSTTEWPSGIFEHRGSTRCLTTDAV